MNWDVVMVWLQKKGGSSKFDGDDVGPCNIHKERIKHVKTFGALLYLYKFVT